MFDEKKGERIVPKKKRVICAAVRELTSSHDAFDVRRVYLPTSTAPRMIATPPQGGRNEVVYGMREVLTRDEVSATTRPLNAISSKIDRDSQALFISVGVLGRAEGNLNAPGETIYFTVRG